MKKLVESLYGSSVDGEVTEELMDGEGGAGPSKLTRVSFISSAGKRVSLVLKQTRFQDASINYGLTREVDFYLQNKDLQSFLPRIYGAVKKDDGSDKNILMEDLSGCQLGYYFGKGSPHNWDRDLPTDRTAAQVSKQSFEAIARLHSKYWGKHDQLFSIPWLRGVDFLQGKNQEGFLALQGFSTSIWTKIKDDVSWDPFVCSLLEASFSRISWDEFKKQERKLTMIHGDFHPANAYLRDDGTLAIFDWEMVGVGNGPQDLGQFVISHMDPQVRRVAEDGLLKSYFKCLDVLDYTRAELKADYAMGGACRWLWFLPILSSSPNFGERAMAFFVNQVGTFCKDHGISPDNVEMPRVC